MYMTRSDIGVIITIYAVCILFLYLTLQLKAAAQIYPLGLIAILALLDTLYLITRIWKMYASGHRKITDDLSKIFNGFQALQFFVIVGACIAYLIALYYLGFYIAGFIYLLGVMYFLKVKQWQIWLTIVLLGLLIYGVFTVFLKVPLPVGLIFR